MTPERWRQIESIFHAAADLEPGARASYIATACGDDLSLRREVESLLAGCGRSIAIMDAPLKEAALRLLAAEQARALVGEVIDHYRVLALLGAGGMGEVYLAEDVELGRKVALKMLPAAFTRDEAQARRFRREARAASALNHPNIITVYEVVQAEAWQYIAMEFIHGESLRQQLRGGRLPAREAVNIASQAASALAAAHQAGIVHRDIKPENVMLRDDGYVKVLDFGIALLNEQFPPTPLAATDAAQADEAEARTHAGTPGYMSPEQTRREPLDARADIYSLGVVLYEMLAGRRPFEGDERGEIGSTHLGDEPPSLSSLHPNIPIALEEIVMRMLRKDRDERYQSARELLDDLRKLQRRLESTDGGSEPLYTGAGAATEAKRIEVGSARATPASLPGFKIWILPAGALAGAAAGLDRLLRPQDASWPLDGVLLLCAGACVFAFFRARRRTLHAPVAFDDGGAFRGLLPFAEADRDRFYGRGPDTAALHAMIARPEFRFGVLYGDSGSGKTSLLTAGLLPRLREDGRLPVYCRSYKDPLVVLLEECGKQTGIRPREAEQPVAYLRRVADALGREIVVVCDQFEEFFINFRTRGARAPFTSFVADCHGAGDLPVKFLFALRSDFLHLISAEFDGRIPEPLMGDKRYHLRSFDEEQAAEIIAEAALDAGLPLGVEFCRQVARDLARGDSVLPSELQIVGAQLQRRRIYTSETYVRAGGKEQLVHGFLEDVIRASGDERTTLLLLRSLISDENTRLALPLGEVARRTQRPHAAVARLVRLLVESRLVRELQEDDPWRYELMHEYLIERVNLITGRMLDATQRANRQLRQYLVNYAADGRARIPLRRLWFIKRHADPEMGARARRLLRRSLRRGLLKAGALALVLAAAATLVAAYFSVRDEWEDARLRDGHTAAARRAIFSPDGRLLVSVGEDSKVLVWDFARRERIATLTDHTGWVNTVAFSPDAKWLATGSSDKTVIVWEAASWQKAYVLREHQTPVDAVAFSPDGQWLASASEPPDARTILWRVGVWEKAREVPVGSGYVNILFSPDSRMFWLGQRWLVATGQPARDDEVTWGSNWNAFSPDGKSIVVVGSDGNVFFCDASSYWTTGRYKLIATQHAHHDNGRAVAFSPDGRLVATGADYIVLWDAATRTKLARLEHTAIVWSLAFSPDGRWLVSTHGDGAILVWDVAERARAADLGGHSAPVRGVAFSPDGRRVASASEDGSVIVWDAVLGQKEAVLTGHRTRVSAVAFAPDGRWVASVDVDGNVIVWDVDRRTPHLAYKQHGNDYALAVSPDGRFVADSYGVHDSADGHAVVAFDRSGLAGDQMYGVSFSPDGRLMATVYAAGRGAILLWDAQRWQLLEHIDLGEVLPTTVSFSPDGRWLVTGDDQGAVRLWSVGPLREVAILGRHEARIKAVVFSPDGSQVASAGDDKMIMLWDVQRHDLVARVGTHATPVLSIAFSPDGRHLVAGEHDNSIHLYTHHRKLWGRPLD
ncbi:MAG: hypothetical protein DMF67_05950 [Acidobacteria bacterium]|nr:MAG: hypothetical protein DMF67_05950 [Acidobacteriota bacterium]